MQSRESRIVEAITKQYEEISKKLEFDKLDNIPKLSENEIDEVHSIAALFKRLRELQSKWSFIKNPNQINPELMIETKKVLRSISSEINISQFTITEIEKTLNIVLSALQPLVTRGLEVIGLLNAENYKKNQEEREKSEDKEQEDKFEEKDESRRNKLLINDLQEAILAKEWELGFLKSGWAGDKVSFEKTINNQSVRIEVKVPKHIADILEIIHQAENSDDYNLAFKKIHKILNDLHNEIKNQNTIERFFSTRHDSTVNFYNEWNDKFEKRFNKKDLLTEPERHTLFQRDS